MQIMNHPSTSTVVGPFFFLYIFYPRSRVEGFLFLFFPEKNEPPFGSDEMRTKTMAAFNPVEPKETQRETRVRSPWREGAIL